MKNILPLPTPEFLRETFSYDKETGVLIRKKGGMGVPKSSIGKEVGFIHKQHGYRIVKIKQVQYLASRIIWCLVTGEDPGQFDVDHKDGNQSNNKWSNLRLLTRSQNCYNRPENTNNKSGLKGVHKDQRTPNHKKHWRAIINGKHIGWFYTPEEAHQAYLETSKEKSNQTNSRAFK